MEGAGEGDGLVRRRGGRGRVVGVDARRDLGPLACKLERRLVRLGARVGEEDAIGEGGLDEAAREVRGGLGVEEVGRVREAAGLLRDGRDPARVRVAERVDGDAGGKVQKLAAGGVPEARALPADEDDVRGAAVGLEHEARVVGDDRGGHVRVDGGGGGGRGRGAAGAGGARGAAQRGAGREGAAGGSRGRAALQRRGGRRAGGPHVRARAEFTRARERAHGRA